jgi:hypothetical protein
VLLVAVKLQDCAVVDAGMGQCLITPRAELQQQHNSKTLLLSSRMKAACQVG